MRRRIALGFGLAIVLLLLLITVVGSADVLEELLAADRSLLGLGIASGVLSLTFRGLVWRQFLLVVDETMTRGHVGSVFLTAMFLKYVTPYGQIATEPVVAYIVSSDAEMAYEDGFAGILSADVLNYVPYYTFGLAALAFVVAIGALGEGMGTQLLAFAGFFVVLVTLVYVVLRRPSVVYRIVLSVAGLARWVLVRVSDAVDERLEPAAVRERLDNFYFSIESITTDRRSLVLAVVYAHVAMVFLMLPVYLGALALGQEVALPIVAIVVALGKLGAVVPSPGGTGGVEAMVTVGLSTLGSIDPAAAFTIALIYRASTYWLTIGIGGVAGFFLLVRQ